MPGWWNGRHEGLKILWLYGCAGSSPASGTTQYLQNPHNLTIVRVFVLMSNKIVTMFNKTSTNRLIINYVLLLNGSL